MNKIIKGIVITGVVVLAIYGVVAGLKHFSGSSTLAGDSYTGFPNGATIGGGTYAADPALVVTGSITVSGTTTNAGAVYSTGGSSVGGLASLTIAGALPASTTLTQANLLNSFISVLPTTGSGTVFLPASTTLTNFLPNAGDCTRFVIFNATTTAGQMIGLAPGTGTLLEIASTTAAVNTVSTGSTTPSRASIVTACRKANTDIIFMSSPFI